MAYKVFVLCKTPADPEAFRRRYEDEHVPLVRRIPGLQRLAVNEVTARAREASGLFLIAEMIYANQASYEAGMKTPAGQAVSAHAKELASDLVTLVGAEQAMAFGGPAEADVEAAS